MSNEKIIAAIITVLGALGLMLIDIKSDTVKTDTKVEAYHEQDIRNNTAAEKDRDTIKQTLFDHITKNK